MATDATRRRMRLIIEVSPELQHRIQAAAAQHDQTVQTYIAEVLEHVIPSIAPSSGRITKETIRRFQRVREETMRGRVFEDDSADIVQEMREKRSQQLADG